ncbi:MAG: hypothetical protein Q4G46_00740 [Propionibacteriaceae bacterium]|nr:hypothetical protein [Propionibacteriaceae bacterium]
MTGRPPALSSRVTLASQLKVGDMLGRGGGQGAVYDLPRQEGYVYKHYYEPISGARQSFAELVDAGVRLTPVLAARRVMALWPVHVLGPGTSVEGYVMPRMPGRFRAEIHTPYGSDLQEATLDFALAPPPGRAFYPVRQLTAGERVELVGLVGHFLQSLHNHGLVYGDLSLKNMRYATDPVELLVMDMDGVHHISTPVIPAKDLANTPDWNDPHRTSELPLGFDLDRYKYALLVYRLIVANSVSQAFPEDASRIVVPHESGLDPEQRAMVEFLLHRAASTGTGGRPPISEWLTVLGPTYTA